MEHSAPLKRIQATTELVVKLSKSVSAPGTQCVGAVTLLSKGPR